MASIMLINSVNPFKVQQNLPSARPRSNRAVPGMLTMKASQTQINSNGPFTKTIISNEECAAAVIAGNISEAPPVVPSKPAAPAGTPVINPLPLSRRPRWNRRTPALRAPFQGTNLSPANLVYPLFIHEGEQDVPIGAMRGCFRLGWTH